MPDYLNKVFLFVLRAFIKKYYEQEWLCSAIKHVKDDLWKHGA